MDRSDTHRTDAAPLLSARTITAAEAKNTNTDITKALHDAMSIPKLTVVRQQALLNELMEHSCTTSTTTMNYDYAATFYNQLLMQTQTMAQHTYDNCLDDQRDDDSAVLDGAAVSSPLPLPSTLPSTLPSPSSPSSVSSSLSSSISYLEDNTEEEQGITCVYHESDHNENELSSSLGESDNDNNNNNNNEGEEEEEGEGDNSVDKGIDWEVPDPDPYAYKEEEEEDDTDEERDNVAVESICQE